MRYWLLKTEPGEYSYDDLERDGKSRWEGVRNNTALLHLRAMKAGDSAFIYHSGKEKRIVAIARIASGPFPDPRAKDPRFVVVDVVPVKRLAGPVPLAEIRKAAELKTIDLVRQSRLSVMPVSEQHWKRILSMAAGR